MENQLYEQNKQKTAIIYGSISVIFLCYTGILIYFISEYPSCGSNILTYSNWLVATAVYMGLHIISIFILLGTNKIATRFAKAMDLIWILIMIIMVTIGIAMLQVFNTCLDTSPRIYILLLVMVIIKLLIIVCFIIISVITYLRRNTNI